MTFPGPAFKPFPFCTNRHVMTIFPHMLPRLAGALKDSAIERIFSVAPNSKVLCHCNIRPGDRPTIIVVHGLESNSHSTNVMGLGLRAWNAGFNVIRMNLRNCGKTMHLTDTLYNAGLSNDVIRVARSIREQDSITAIFLAGYSLGGNVILKAAAELGKEGPELIAGVCGISPAIDLLACVESMEKGFNRLYDFRFLWSLKEKIKQRDHLKPGTYQTQQLSQIKTLREFDGVYTCKDAGYESAEDYYAGASALRIINEIVTPTLVIAAQDDPIVPFSSFAAAKLKSDAITLLAPEHGGHGGFLSAAAEPDGQGGSLGRFWAENRVVEFCIRQLETAEAKS